MNKHGLARFAAITATGLLVTLAVTGPAQAVGGATRRPSAATRDSDRDGMPDVWERANGLNVHRNDAAADPDHDRLSNLREFTAGTRPHKADTDADGMPDGWELGHGLDAVHNDAAGDPDADDLTNRQEFTVGDDPHKADSDADGLPDGHEDSDGDGLDDENEFRIGDNPKKHDSDGDGVPDGQERSGTITSYDPATRLLAVALGTGGTTLAVTVTDSTKITWHHASAHCPAPAGTADLTAGRLVRKLKLTGSHHEEADGAPTTPTAKEISLICG